MYGQAAVGPQSNDPSAQNYQHRGQSGQGQDRCSRRVIGNLTSVHKAPHVDKKAQHIMGKQSRDKDDRSADEKRGQQRGPAVIGRLLRLRTAVEVLQPHQPLKSRKNAFTHPNEIARQSWIKLSPKFAQLRIPACIHHRSKKVAAP